VPGDRRPAFVALRSPAWDFGWFVLPGILAILAGLVIGLRGDASAARQDTDLPLWIAGVLLVDVAHVWASLYRTYLDPEARRLHRKRLIWIPLLCGWVSFLLHLESPLLLWSALAYVAIFHFIKQHIGFALLYVRAGGEARIDRKLATWAIWAGTLGPVIWWHANLPTAFAWFMDGDLVTGLPRSLGTVALLAQVPVWVAFVVRRVTLATRGAPNPMLVLLVLVPAASWHLGIVVFNDDRVFTITNVFLHGIPYLALVWIAGGATLIRDRWPGRRPPVLPLCLAAYYGVVAVLATTEELLWDRFVWHDRPELFGASDVDLAAHPILLAAAVALLTVPQATHYILDRYIWRAGPDNPRLAGQLGLTR
jgi:hypothetical protein